MQTVTAAVRIRLRRLGIVFAMEWRLLQLSVCGSVQLCAAVQRLSSAEKRKWAEPVHAQSVLMMMFTLFVAGNIN